MSARSYRHTYREGPRRPEPPISPGQMQDNNNRLIEFPSPDPGGAIHVRLATEKDRPTLERIYLETRCFAFDWMDLSTFELEDFERDTRDEKIWVAALDSIAAGFVSVCTAENFVHHLYVLPERQGQGIGAALLSTCLQNIGRPAGLKCLAPNIQARDFYLGQGWYIVARDQGPQGPYLLMHYAESPPTHRAVVQDPAAREKMH
jgi:GNAT superfamily N-acetyltransferase